MRPMHPFISDAAGARAKTSIQRSSLGLVGHALYRAVEILNAHRQVHENMAGLLLQKETLDELDLDTLRAQIRPAQPSDAAPAKPASAKRAPVALA
jgi:ATP-dependent Zn protease